MKVEALFDASYRITRRPGEVRAAPNLGVEPPEWTLSALCAQVDAEFWFPEKGGSTREAKSVCAVCPVRAECLAFGLHDRFGIYGGFSERERRGLIRSGWRPGDPVPAVPHYRGKQAAA